MTWHPVALAAGLETGTSTGTRVLGREYVVWRDSAGASHVWEDRCPHRGMRLSFGFVRGDHIACLYHGWQYDAAGQCRLIPAHPDIKVPSTIRATRYRSVERIGMVWVEVDEAGEPPEDVGDITPVRTVTIEVSCAPVQAALGAALARVAVGRLEVIAGVQPLSETETAVHLAIIGSAGPPERRSVAFWGMALRDRLEQPA